MPSANQKSLWIGLAAVFAVGTASWWLAQFAPRLGSVTIAIILGVLVGNLLFNNKSGDAGGKFAEKKLLPIAITLLGVELQLMSLVALGSVAALIIGVSIATSLLVSVQLGKLMGFSENFSLLMGAGNGICGSSAVAATSIAIDADENATGISISVVNLLGTIGIFVMPALIRLFELGDVDGGLLVGGTLQAFGQVVAAGFSVNDDVGQIATVVKMGRVLMLGPVVILIGSWIQSRRSSDDEGQGGGAVQIPRFIIGFFVLSLIASANILSPEILTLIKTAGKYLLVLAMAGVGMRIQLRTLFRSGLGAFLFGSLVSVIQITMTLLLIFLIV